MFNWWRKLKIKWAKKELEKYAPKGEHLAYITKEEAKLLKKHGGAGLKVTATGIPSFFLDKIVRGVSNFVGGVVDSVTGIIGDLIGGIGDIIGGIVDFVGNIANGFLGMFGMSFDMPDYESPTSFETFQQGILVNKQSAVGGIPVVYGKRRIGGTRVFIDTAGNDNEFLYVCLAMCEGEIEGVNRIYINDIEVNFPERSGSNSLYTKETIMDVTKFASGGRSPYFVNDKARVKIEIFHGTEDQQASTLLRGSRFWTQKHRLRGVAYLALRFEWVKAEYEGTTQTVFNPWQGIPTVQAEVFGKKVLTSYSASDNTDSDTSSYETQQANTGVGAFAYSDNPANIILDYLRNPRYGKGLKDNRIDFGAFRTAKLTTEQSIVYTDSFTGNFMVCNAVINTEDTLMNNTKRLLQSCRGYLPYIDGKYALKVETAEIPVDQFEITDDMIIGEINIQSADKNAKYNECHIAYADEDNKFESNTFVFKDSTAAAQDGEALVLKTSLPTITKLERIRHMAKYMVDRSRKQLIVGLRLTNEGQSIVAGDLVRITHQYNRSLGGTDITDFLFKSPTGSAVDTVYSAPEMIFRVVNTTLNYDGTVGVQLMEHDNFMYSVATEEITPEPPIETPPPDPDPPTPEPPGENPPTPNPPPTPPPVTCPDGFVYNPDTQQCEAVPTDPEPTPPNPDPDPDPPPAPPPTGPVRTFTGTNYGYQGYITFEVKPSGMRGAVIAFDITNETTDYRQIWHRPATGSTMTYTVRSGGRGMTIRPGNVLRWTVYEMNNIGNHVVLGQGIDVIAGDPTQQSNTVSSTNVSGGGYA